MNRVTSEPQPSAARPIRLLLVDDEPAVLQSLRRSLAAESYQVHTAESGAQALECLERICIDVVLSDIQMPGMRGTELLARVATRWPDTSRIALTGTADMADAITAIKKVYN
jgi:DNA-binding NtrC family response regulator